MRKELLDLIRKAMEQHELSRDFYHRLAHQVTQADIREMFEYLAQEAEANQARLHLIHNFLYPRESRKVPVQELLIRLSQVRILPGAPTRTARLSLRTLGPSAPSR